MPFFGPAHAVSTDRPALGLSHPESGLFAPVSPASWKRARYPLGAHTGADEESATFAVFAPRATAVLLEIYAQPIQQASSQEPLFDYWLAQGKDGTWRACVEWQPVGAAPLFYGYRCFGPNWPLHPDFRRGGSAAGFICDVDGAGNRFNPNKLLIDPYAREISHDKECPEVSALGHHGGAYGTGLGHYRGIGDALPSRPRREVDTGAFAPKSVLIDDASSFGVKPRIKQQDAAIYEAHVRGLTRHPSSSRLRATLGHLQGFEGVADVPEKLRGTYLGAGYMAPYLKALGITTIEFLPVHECANDLNGEGLREADGPGRTGAAANYWGYMTYAFFAPDRRYAHDRTPGGATREFKGMVKAFHDQGIEVYLDVVYNHHGEGGLWGKPDGSGADPDTAEVLSLRGFDNAGYYALTGDPRYYWDSTGCGNNLDASQSVVQNLIKDSLLYWSQEMGVDGFRFDLASVLGRHRDHGYSFLPASTLLADIAAMAKKHRIEVIAEAWDTGGYHVGGFPTGWGEWNGHYRDSVRRFGKGAGNAFDFIAVMNGDFDRYADQGGAHKSVNFITAHDGFTLLDLVSYDGKSNGQAWPFGPSDGGSDNNDSWGSSGDPALRRQRLRNFFTFLVFARGVPMLVAGDEYGRTQNGNNNPYNLDNVGMWQNWDMAGSPTPTRLSVMERSAMADGHSDPGAAITYHDNYGDNGGEANKLLGFVQFLLSLRAVHASLRQIKYGDMQLDAGRDVTYAFSRPDGSWHFQGGERSMMLRIDGSEVRDRDFLLLINMQAESVDFSLHQPHANRQWARLVDTAPWAESKAEGVAEGETEGRAQEQGNYWLPHQAERLANHYRVHAWSVVVLQEL
jgi:isoamylase